MPHNTTRLQQLGADLQRLTTERATIRAAIAPEIAAAAKAGIPQHQIVAWTGLSREAIRVASNPAIRDSVNTRRRKTRPTAES